MNATRRWERWFVEREALPPLAAREVVLSLGEIRDRIVENARIRPGESVVDVGCGRGLITFAAADATGARGAVVGVDVDEEALGAVRPLAREIGVGLVNADGRALPLPPGWADVVVWRSVLVYLEGRDRLLGEVRRVLTPGGRISFSESLARDLDLHAGDAMLDDLWAALKEFASAALGGTMFDASSLESLVAAAGFEGVRVERERRRTRLPDTRAVRAFFESGPNGGLAAVWRACGIEPAVVDAFLAGVAARTPLLVETPEAYVTARRTPG